MIKYHLKIINSYSWNEVVEADGFSVSDGFYCFYESLISSNKRRTIAQYPIERTIIHKIEYND